jgi:hypothetical protein
MCSAAPARHAEPARVLRDSRVWREQRWSAYAVVRLDAFLPQLRRDKLRVYVACPDEALRGERQAERTDLACPDEALRGERQAGGERSLEAAGVELDTVFRNRPIFAFSPKTVPAQHAGSAEHAFHSPKSAPANGDAFRPP